MKIVKIVILFLLIPLFIISARAQDTINVQSGWNMIGTGSTLVISEMRSEPPGIVISSFYGYNSGAGYKQTDTLKKNKGYWVKASQSGILILRLIAGSCPATVAYAGKTYNTVQIGSQCWLKENLDVGTMVYNLQEQTNNSVIEKFCYQDSIENCTLYGGLYQWNEAMQYSSTAGAQGICPTGWHIPTYAEFDTLANAVGHDGNSLKAIGQGTGDGAGTNTSGFSALLAGYRFDRFFGDLGRSEFFWGSTPYPQDSISATTLHLYYIDAPTFLDYYEKTCGLSVRCIRD